MNYAFDKAAPTEVYIETVLASLSSWAEKQEWCHTRAWPCDVHLFVGDSNLHVNSSKKYFREIADVFFDSIVKDQLLRVFSGCIIVIFKITEYPVSFVVRNSGKSFTKYFSFKRA